VESELTDLLTIGIDCVNVAMTIKRKAIAKAVEIYESTATKDPCIILTIKDNVNAIKNNDAAVIAYCCVSG
jgi:hypothetical protein